MPAFIEAQLDGDGELATFYLMINKTRVRNTWSASYHDYQTGRTLFGVNDCDNLNEVAIRLGGRLRRWQQRQLQPPRTLRDLPKSDTVGSANLTEGLHMADTASENQQLTYGGKAVGLSFNPSKNTEVDDIKQAAANFIDAVCGPTGEKLDFGQGKDNEAASMRKLAMRAAQEAQMWAVKAATWNSDGDANTAAPAAGTATGQEGNTGDPLNQGVAKPDADAAKQ